MEPIKIEADGITIISFPDGSTIIEQKSTCSQVHIPAGTAEKLNRMAKESVTRMVNRESAKMVDEFNKIFQGKGEL